MKIKRTLMAIAVVSAFAAVSGQAATIAAWNTTGLSGVTAGNLAATTTLSGIDSATLSRGAGLTAESLANGYSSSGWSASLAAARTSSDFYQVTLAPTVGQTISFDSLNLNFRNTATGVRSMVWEFSLDGFATAGTIVGPTFTLPGATTVADYGPINLSGVAALQGVASTVTFRLFGWNDTGNLAAGGTGAVGTNTGDNLVFSGTTTAAIPEPKAALLGSIGVLLLLRRRYR